MIGMSCFDCSSTKLIHIIADGDIVCGSCGVIQESHVIDNTYRGNVTYNDETEVVYHVSSCDDYHPLKKILQTASFHLLDTEHSLVIQRTIHYFDMVIARNDGVTTRGDRKKGALATCFYLATRQCQVGLSVDVIYSYFGVPTWKEYSNIVRVLGPELVVGTSTVCDSLRRMVYSCQDIDYKMQWDIIKVAEQIKDKVHHIVGLNGKPSKLNVCYIYIARKILEPNKVCIDKHCEQFGTSASTLQRHEKMIQAALQHQPNNKSSSI